MKKITFLFLIITAVGLQATDYTHPTGQDDFFNMNPQPSDLRQYEFHDQPQQYNLESDIEKNEEALKADPQLSYYDKFQVKDIESVPPKPGQNRVRGRFTNQFQQSDIPQGPPEPGRIYFNPSYNDVFQRSSIQQVAPTPGGGRPTINPYNEPLDEGNIPHTPPTPGGQRDLPTQEIYDSPYRGYDSGFNSFSEDKTTTISVLKHEPIKSADAVPFTEEPAKSTEEAAPMTQEPAQSTEEVAVPIAKDTVLDVAQASPELSTFIDLIKKAGLVEFLNGNGPFTIFAPNDHAFSKLPPDNLNELKANKEELAKTLKFLILPGKLSSNDFKNMKVKTESGRGMTIRVSGDTIMVENGKVVETDILAKNGIIHIVDTMIKQ